MRRWCLRIARRVATDRVISPVEVEARHGHKSHERRFDGYKTYISVAPDSELIDEVAVTAANAADHDVLDDPWPRSPRRPTSRWFRW
jgi:hypothetical protein